MDTSQLLFVLGSPKSGYGRLLAKSADMAGVKLIFVEDSEFYSDNQEEIMRHGVIFLDSDWTLFFLYETELPPFYWVHAKGEKALGFDTQGEFEVWSTYSDDVLLSKALKTWTTNGGS